MKLSQTNELYTCTELIIGISVFPLYHFVLAINHQQDLIV